MMHSTLYNAALLGTYRSTSGDLLKKVYLSGVFACLNETLCERCDYCHLLKALEELEPGWLEYLVEQEDRAACQS